MAPPAIARLKSYLANKHVDQTPDEELREKIRTTLRKLECPFTWNSSMVVMDDECIKKTIDRLPLAVGSWDTIIQKCHLAYSQFQKGNVPKSSQFMVECFMPLLKLPGLETSCQLTQKYRQGLKHVLDATSAFIRYEYAKEDMSIIDAYYFMSSIPSVESMDNKQKAAISAIRCRLAKYPANKVYAEAAIALNPDEIQWHTYLAKVLVKGGPNIDIGDVIDNNDIFLERTWESPEPYLLVADFIITHGHPDRGHLNQALECILKALDQFPNSPYVYEKAADLLLKCTPRTEHVVTGNLEKIQIFYKTALRLAGKEILSVRHKIGVYQVLFAEHERKSEGVENLKLARNFSPESEIDYALARAGKLTFSSLWVHSSFMSGICEYDGYDDDNAGEEELLSFSHVPLKVSKKSASSKIGKKKGKECCQVTESKMLNKRILINRVQ